jgi:glycosyltransferase involved in cell wall biosynthesis
MKPTFSIVIPSKDRPELLHTCLTSLLQLDFPRENFEIIVVDDFSGVSLTDVCRPFVERLPVQILHHSKSRGPAAARNTGAERARGKYLAFLDDDCAPDPQWLKAYQKGFANSGRKALAGRTLNPEPHVIGAQVWCLVQAFQYDYWQDEGGNLKIAISNNMAVEREAYFDVGGFDASFPVAASEDRDFSWRFNEAGYQIGHVPDAIVWHFQTALSSIPYLRLQYRYGRFAGIQRQKQRAATAAEFAERFGSRSRLRYARYLLAFALQNKASFSEIALLYLGHLAHFLGRSSSPLGD